MVEEYLMHLKMELVTALRSSNIHIMMLKEEEASLDDKKVEAGENNFDASNVTKKDINPMTVQKIVVIIREMLLLLLLKENNIILQK